MNHSPSRCRGLTLIFAMSVTVGVNSSMAALGQEQAAHPDPVSVIPTPVTPAVSNERQPTATGQSTQLPQVLVQIKAFEISLTKLERLGKDIKSLGCRQGVVTDASPMLKTMKALGRDGVLRSVAQPELVTVVGEPTKYHVGGEVAIPRPQKDGTTVMEQQPYGTEMELTANILKDQTIHMDFHMRLSELTSEVKHVDGHAVPTIEATGYRGPLDMKSGQTVVIEGLITQRTIETSSGMPWIKEIPGIGGLFTRKKTEIERTQTIFFVRAENVSDGNMSTEARRFSGKEIAEWPGERPQ